MRQKALGLMEIEGMLLRDDKEEENKRIAHTFQNLKILVGVQVSMRQRRFLN